VGTNGRFLLPCTLSCRILQAGLTDGATKDVFVHISAVEKAGLSDLREGTKVSYDVIANRGKDSAENLRIS
jgi:cold shock protein